MDSNKKKIPPQLNKFMHPRNPYKKSPPSFKDLATLYPEFRAHCTYDITGKIFLDFKNVDALRALTTCLLDKDFGLKVNIPANRLVPTLPLRLNYLLWMEDLLSTVYPKHSRVINDQSIIGLDIGAGAACIYPLLGIKKFQWKFIATEDDDISFNAGKANIDQNYLQDDILLLKESSMFDILDMPLVQKFVKNIKQQSKNVDELDVTSSVTGNSHEFTIDFTVCNPPFFSSDEELHSNHNSKKETRSSPTSVSTGSPHEKVTDGGELSFISKMVEMSLRFKDKVKIFSTLVGKQSDVKKVVRIIKDKANDELLCVKVCDTEFCQGRTMRWGVAWTFCNGVSLERISSQKKRITQKPLVLNIPRSLMTSYNVTNVWNNIALWLKDIKIKPVVFKENSYFVGASIKAYKPTWKNQRLKRREKERVARTQQGGKLTTDDASLSRISKRSQEDENGREDPNFPKKMRIDSCLSSSEEDGCQNNSSLSEDHHSSLLESDSSSLDQSGSSTTDECNSGLSNLNLSNHNNKMEISGQEVKSDDESRNTSCIMSKSNGNTRNSISKLLSKTSTSPMTVITEESLETKTSNSTDTKTTVKQPNELFLKCSLHLKQTNSVISVELSYVDGRGGKEAMNQLLQYLKNKLSQRA